MALLLWVFSCSLFSLWILSFMRSQATEARHGTLAVMCDERARILQDQVKVSMNHLQALAILVSTFHHSKTPSAIDQTPHSRAHRVRASADERAGVRRSGDALRARGSCSSGSKLAWSIREMNFSSKRPRAEEYDAYKHVVSIDMLSGAEDRGNLLRARESGKVVLTAPFQLLNKRIGVVLTYAVYKSELPLNATVHDRIQSSIGYLGGVFDIEGHVDKLLEKLAGKEPMTVNIYDTTVEDGYKATDMQMPAKDEFAATERISDMERDLKEDALFFDTIKSPSLLEISRLLNHRDPAQNVLQEEQELNLPLEVQDKLKETERKLGRMSKFITKVMKLTSASIRCLSSRFHCFNKKVWSIILLGFLLFILVIGAFDQPYNNQPLSMGGEGDNNMMLKNFGFSRGRLLIDTLHGTWTKRGVQSSDTIRVDLRKMTGNSDSSGRQLKH
uniref:CHASE domain-containing protein n=1 Tax=Oryza barthii TaxID=65489 RepID=A0A0D3HU73_9ORYZ